MRLMSCWASGPWSADEGGFSQWLGSTTQNRFLSALPGVTCVLAPKFSASRFWDDCRQHGVTVIQYVGEVLRYLCNTPQVRC